MWLRNALVGKIVIHSDYYARHNVIRVYDYDEWTARVEFIPPTVHFSNICM